MKKLEKIISILFIFILLSVSILPKFSYAEPQQSTDKYVVALDPGHGNGDPGACYNGLQERTLIEKTVSYIKQYLEQNNVTVVIVGPWEGQNSGVSLSGRYENAKNANADFILSVHYNSGGGQGAEVLWKSESSKSIAANMSKSISETAGLNNRGAKHYQRDTGRNITLGNLGPENSTIPAVLIEGGFVDSSDRNVISTEEGLKKIAQGSVKTIMEYFNSPASFGDVNSYEGGSSSSGMQSAGKGTTEVNSNEYKFLGLWKNSVGKYVPYYNEDGTINADAMYNKKGKLVNYKFFGSPVDTILSSADWLSHLLTSSERTQEHDKIMKYLMYIYTGKDYGVTDYDFSIFDIDAFSTVTAGGSGAFTEYLKAWEGAAVNAAGNYIVEHNAPDVPTVGYGVAIKYNVDRIKSICNYSGDPNTWSKGEELLSKYGVTNEQIDKVKEAEVEESRQEIKKETAGLNLTVQQEDALIAIKYQFGNIGNFVEMYKKYGNTEELRTHVTDNSQYKYKYFESGKYSRYKSPWELKRSAANWKLFHEGIYTDSEGNEIKAANGTGGDIIQKAQECVDILNSRGVTYGYGGGAVPMTEAYKTIDCSHYVSWVLYECGYDFGYWTSYSFEKNSWNWEKITDKANLQPGDVLVYDGHVDIYAGPGSDGSNINKVKKYNAGATNTIRQSPYESEWRHGYKFALRPSK